MLSTNVLKDSYVIACELKDEDGKEYILLGNFSGDDDKKALNDKIKIDMFRYLLDSLKEENSTDLGEFPEDNDYRFSKDNIIPFPLKYLSSNLKEKGLTPQSGMMYLGSGVTGNGPLNDFTSAFARSNNDLGYLMVLPDGIGFDNNQIHTWSSLKRK